MNFLIIFKEIFDRVMYFKNKLTLANGYGKTNKTNISNEYLLQVEFDTRQNFELQFSILVSS